jgi:CheY-like chemotaxis protein
LGREFADARELFKVILERSGAETAVVSSGQEALEAIRDLHPDAAICDLLFTAAARDEDRAATRLAGFQAHLAKSIEPEN